jgi:hypothetical protein
VFDFPFRVALPPDVDGALRPTIGIGLEALDHSPDDAGVLAHEVDVPTHEVDVPA